MTPWFLLFLQTEGVLPPPPEPTGSPSIDTTRVIGVVVVSLGVIVLAALALKPLVLRGRTVVDEPEPEAEEPELPAVPMPGTSSIIQFPRIASMEDDDDEWEEANEVVADRLNRVVGDPGGRRRKLGDRSSGTPSGRSGAAPAYARPAHPGFVPRPVVPLHGTAAPAAQAAPYGQQPVPQPVVPAQPVWTPPVVQPVVPPVTPHVPVWSPPPPPVASPAAWQSTPSGLPSDLAGYGTWPPVSAPVNPPSTRPAGPTPPPVQPQVAKAMPDPVDDPLDALLGKLPPTPVVAPSPVVPPRSALDDLLGPLSVSKADEAADDSSVLLPFRQSEEPPIGHDSILGPDFDEIAAELDAMTASFDDSSESEVDLDLWQMADEQPNSDATWTAILAPVAKSSDPSDVDAETVEGVQKTIRELLFCANVGELLHGFALYSDPFLFRFMDATGMSEAEFRKAYGSMKPKAPETWTRLKGLTDIVRLPDGRVEATASYCDPTGAPANGRERYRFEYSPQRGLWMIDNIEVVD